jgi:cytosine/adenosine deaminase-related metal-dependent hydrolase
VWPRPVSIVNARVVTPAGERPSIRFARRILSVGARPVRGDRVVDAEGRFVVPGLINAHDHLELNHYGALKGRDRYANASEWIRDIEPRLTRDAAVVANRSYSLSHRLFVGGLKNLLSGATTVAHHNPLYAEIRTRFPVRVVRRYGWAHSFFLEGGAAGARGEPAGRVSARYHATPSDRPFIVHVGEGIDATAAAELPRLDALGCLGHNTVIVHGVALRASDWSALVQRGAALVWCPASNVFLFGRTLDVRAFLDHPGGESRICLGTDSRLTGSGDLLDELRLAAACDRVTARELFAMVTANAARILCLDDIGRLAAGARADLVMLRSHRPTAEDALLASVRRDLDLVAIDGRPLIGSPALQAIFDARGCRTRRLIVDGAERLADARLTRAIARCPIREPGVAAA